MSYITYGNFTFAASSGFPVPQISISTTPLRAADAGITLTSKTTVNLEGQIYFASGARGFGALTSGEKILRETFSNGCTAFFSVGCTGGGGARQPPFFSGAAVVNNYSSNKTADRWTNTIEYSIELEVAAATGTGIYNISSAQDEINIETLDEYSHVGSPFNHPALRTSFNFPISTLYPVYRVSRSLSAVGKLGTSGTGTSCPPNTGSGLTTVRNAMNWVLDQANKFPFSGMLSGLLLYNFTRAISINAVEGSYRLTDNFIGVPNGAALSGGAYLESFTAESNLDNTYLRTVTINGTIKGLEPFNSGTIYATGSVGGGSSQGGVTSGVGLSGTIYNIYGAHGISGTTKFHNALSGYSGVKYGNRMFDRAQAFIEKANEPSGLFRRFFSRDENPMNPIPVSVTEGYNPAEGSVTYSWVFNNRPLNLVSGSISETLTINDTLPSQQIAEIFVLGRRLGPVLQNLGSYTAASRDVTFEVVLIRPSSLSGLRFPKTAYSSITGIVELFNPKYLLAGQCDSYVKANTESWNITENRFVKQKTWVWTKCVGDTANLTNPNIEQ